MEVVERTLQDLADAYAVPIAASHGVLDDSGDQLPPCLCFDVQGQSEPYCLEFTARQLAAMASARHLADRRAVEHMSREKLQALISY
jgi:hypothetical protein